MFQNLHLRDPVPGVRGKARFNQPATYSKPWSFLLVGRAMPELKTLGNESSSLWTPGSPFLFSVWSSQVNDPSQWAMPAADLLEKGLFISKRDLPKPGRSLCPTWSRYCQCASPSKMSWSPGWQLGRKLNGLEDLLRKQNTLKMFDLGTILLYVHKTMF